MWYRPTEMCSGSEAGSYFRLIDFVYHSILGLRVIKKEQYRPTRLMTMRGLRFNRSGFGALNV